MQQQSDFAFLTCSPALGSALPAKIPDAHALEPKPANMLFIECALGAPVEDRIRVEKDPGRREVVIEPARLAGGYFCTAEAFPKYIQPRQHDPHLLDIRIAVDNDQQLRPVDPLAASRDCSLRPGNPSSLTFRAVDDHARHFAHQSGA